MSGSIGHWGFPFFFRCQSEVSKMFHTINPLGAERIKRFWKSVAVAFVIEFHPFKPPFRKLENNSDWKNVLFAQRMIEGTFYSRSGFGYSKVAS